MTRVMFRGQGRTGPVMKRRQDDAAYLESQADRLDRALSEAGLASTMLLQVHDELIVEAPEQEVELAAEIVRREMEGAAELSVPLVVDIGVGDNWLDAKA